MKRAESCEESIPSERSYISNQSHIIDAQHVHHGTVIIQNKLWVVSRNNRHFICTVGLTLFCKYFGAADYHQRSEVMAFLSIYLIYEELGGGQTADTSSAHSSSHRLQRLTGRKSPDGFQRSWQTACQTAACYSKTMQSFIEMEDLIGKWNLSEWKCDKRINWDCLLSVISEEVRTPPTSAVITV